MADIKQAMQYAYDNPDSDFAKNFEKLASSGSLDSEAKNYGIDLSSFKSPTVGERIAGVAGEIVKPFERIGSGVLNLLPGEDKSSRTGLFGNEVPTLGYRDGEKLQGADLAKDVAGTALEAGSYAIPVGAGARGLTAIGKGVVAGAKTGALMGAGQALQEGKTTGEVITESLKYGAGGALFGGAIPLAVTGVPAVAKGAKALANGKTANIKTSLGSYAEDAVKKETSSLLGSTRSISKANDLAASKGVNLNDIISDPTVFNGIKIVDKKIDPNDAIQVLDDRITTLVDAKKNMLPEFDRLVPKQSKEILRERAIADVKGKVLPQDEASIIESINSQIDALPNELSVSDIDAIRAKARTSARDAKGIQKRSNEYAAIENAARDTVFDITDNLPVANPQEYKAVNDTIKQWIIARDFLENNLKGQVVKGGRLQNYVARGIGALAGYQTGPLGAILGSEFGGTISNIIVNNQLGSSMKMKLIKNITDDPAIIKKAEELLKDVTNTNLLMLPNPSGKVGATGKEVIEALPSRKDRSVGFSN